MRLRTLSCATISAPALAKFSLPPVWSPCQCVLSTNLTGFGVIAAIAAWIFGVSGAYWSSIRKTASLPTESADVAAGAHQHVDAVRELFGGDLDLAEILLRGGGPNGTAREGRDERRGATRTRARDRQGSSRASWHDRGSAVCCPSGTCRIPTRASNIGRPSPRATSLLTPTDICNDIILLCGRTRLQRDGPITTRGGPTMNTLSRNGGFWIAVGTAAGALAGVPWDGARWGSRWGSSWASSAATSPGAERALVRGRRAASAARFPSPWHGRQESFSVAGRSGRLDGHPEARPGRSCAA